MLVCEELERLCDLIAADLDYRLTPTVTLLQELLLREDLRHLHFITTDCVMHFRVLSSVLSTEENRALSHYLFSLGKSDVKSQQRLTQHFKAYICQFKAEYREKYCKDARIYPACGFFFGITVSLLLV